MKIKIADITSTLNTHTHCSTYYSIMLLHNNTILHVLSNDGNNAYTTELIQTLFSTKVMFLMLGKDSDQRS